MYYYINYSLFSYSFTVVSFRTNNGEFKESLNTMNSKVKRAKRLVNYGRGIKEPESVRNNKRVQKMFSKQKFLPLLLRSHKSLKKKCKATTTA